ncbi:hypothetical protein PHSY_006666 [Pseudozyma hubeiensis SY62]|uniref:Uncharacterized protein n=1 Tax=Pseudozyma hubeiensis (strain SY62) TaxID=1305764 RepID=R9PCI2_PSEHS|nr:hypothetical protein PHSY_006666 [Pseudozyma hubeiensis SY62]GAC99069.1 hypothetical protein PHSY_006666 [Pseudozyma hubeiensis SY62]
MLRRRLTSSSYLLRTERGRIHDGQSREGRRVWLNWCAELPREVLRQVDQQQHREGRWKQGLRDRLLQVRPDADPAGLLRQRQRPRLPVKDQDHLDRKEADPMEDLGARRKVRWIDGRTCLSTRVLVQMDGPKPLDVREKRRMLRKCAVTAEIRRTMAGSYEAKRANVTLTP